jgi:hypothetical protein
MRVKKEKDEVLIICLSNFFIVRWRGLKSRIFITAGVDLRLYAACLSGFLRGVDFV